MSTRTRQDWVLWMQLGCALVATAHAEYTLALATGLHWVVAGAVPGALDLYVIRALQKHKDVLPAVLVMIAANVASILVQAGVLPLHWGLYSAVGALVPVLVWRGHVLRAHSGAVKSPECAVPEAVPAVPESDAQWLPEFLAEQVHPSAPAPCQLSEPLMRNATHPCGECGQPWGEHPEVQRKLAERVHLSAPALPPLPPTYLAEYTDQVHAPDTGARLGADDAVHLPSAQAYLAECAVSSTHPSVRGLKKYAGVGQDRAMRLLDHLGETR